MNTNQSKRKAEFKKSKTSQPTYTDSTHYFGEDYPVEMSL